MGNDIHISLAAVENRGTCIMPDAHVVEISVNLGNSVITDIVGLSIRCEMEENKNGRCRIEAGAVQNSIENRAEVDIYRHEKLDRLVSRISDAMV